MEVHIAREKIFDFAAVDGSLGGYVRIGRYPNLNTVWYWAALVGPDRPTVLVVDDGSPDGTGALADRLAATDSGIHVLHRAEKAGLGAAYLAGQVDTLMRAKGYTATDWQTRVFPGAIHDEASWAARLDQPLVFLLGRR